MQLDKNKNFMRLWEDMTSAAKSIGLKKSSGITLVCQEKQKTAGGYIWMYKEDYEKEFGKIV